MVIKKQEPLRHKTLKAPAFLLFHYNITITQKDFLYNSINHIHGNIFYAHL